MVPLKIELIQNEQHWLINLYTYKRQFKVIERANTCYTMNQDHSDDVSFLLPHSLLVDLIFQEFYAIIGNQGQSLLQQSMTQFSDGDQIRVMRGKFIWMQLMLEIDVTLKYAAEGRVGLVNRKCQETVVWRR